MSTAAAPAARLRKCAARSSLIFDADGEIPIASEDEEQAVLEALLGLFEGEA